jgi:hypothetical protein
MTTTPLATPLHARRAALALEGFDPTPLGYHQVGAGESLATIARLWYGPRKGGLYTLIIEANFLVGVAVDVGQILVIPRAGWRLL